jgi:hypothetical protein
MIYFDQAVKLRGVIWKIFHHFYYIFLDNYVFLLKLVIIGYPLLKKNNLSILNVENLS